MSEVKKKSPKKAGAPKEKEKAAAKKKKAKVEVAAPVKKPVAAPPSLPVEVKAPPRVEKPLAAAPAVQPAVEVKVKAKPKPALPAGPRYYGTGRRKESTAKVWLMLGSGKVTVNGLDYVKYFCSRKLLEFQVNRPFATTQTAGKYDVFADVFGGGVPAQATAVSLGIARALVMLNPGLKVLLKREGLLTRDPRMKERKKYGLKRARRAFQYSKR